MKNIIEFKKSFGGREKYFPTQFKKDATNDCVIRAISHATGLDYMKVFKDLCNLAVEIGHLPNNERTYEVYLSSLGWSKRSPMKCTKGRKLRLKNYKEDGTYIVKTTSHLTCVKDGILYDSWDCRRWSANSYFSKEV